MKTAMVTGGTRGIGLAIARKLHENGYEVLVTGRRQETELPPEIREKFLYVRCDNGDAGQRENLLRTLYGHFDHLDVLVNNAGMAPRVRTDLLEMTQESLDELLRVNLEGPLMLTQQVARKMMETGKGMIINISSVSAYAASLNRGEYCISKAGVSMMTQLFALRLAEYGIPVYEIRPGIIRTDMTSGVKEKYDRLIEGGITPIRRWGEGEDIAKAVEMLVSGALPFSTGEVINVDGGFHLRML